MTIISGQTAVVTGAGSGIGAALATALAAKGARLALLDIDTDAVQTTANVLAAKGADILYRAVDVSDAAALFDFAKHIHEQYGDVQWLFNNAGVLGNAGLFVEQSAVDWQRCLSVNLMGVINGMQAFLPRMLNSNKACHIVNIASIAALMRQPRMSPYYTSKSAVMAVSEVVALECEHSCVDIHIVCPGAVATRIAESALSLEQSSESSAALSAFNNVIDEGMEPAALATTIIEKIVAGDRYILTHAAHNKDIEQRFAAITAALPAL